MATPLSTIRMELQCGAQTMTPEERASQQHLRTAERDDGHEDTAAARHDPPHRLHESSLPLCPLLVPVHPVSCLHNDCRPQDTKHFRLYPSQMAFPKSLPKPLVDGTALATRGNGASSSSI